MYINNSLEQEGKFLLVYEEGEYNERTTFTEKFQTKEDLLAGVNKLAISKEVVTIIFAGEIRKEFNLIPKEAIVKYDIEG